MGRKLQNTRDEWYTESKCGELGTRDYGEKKGKCHCLPF